MKIKLYYVENEKIGKGRFIALYPATDFKLYGYMGIHQRTSILERLDFIDISGEEKAFTVEFQEALFACIALRKMDVFYIEHLSEQIEILSSNSKWQEMLEENCLKYNHKDLPFILAETIRCIEDARIPELLKYSLEELEGENQDNFNSQLFPKIK